MLSLRSLIIPSLLAFLGINGCGTGPSSDPIRSEQDTAQWKLSETLQVNPRGDHPLEYTYLRHPALEADGKGNPFVVWTRGEAAGMVFQSLVQDGKAWSAPVPVFSQSQKSWEDFPAVAVDSAKGEIYVAGWRKAVSTPLAVGGGGKIDVFAKSKDGGKSWEKERSISKFGGAFAPDLVYGGNGKLYSAWKDERNRLSDLYFNASQDSGDTWPKEDIRLTPGKPGNGVSSFPSIVPGAGGNVFLMFSHAEEGKNCAIQFCRSEDYGVTWSPAMRVNDNPENHMDFPQMTGDGENGLAATWLYFLPDGFGAIYFDRSLDGGKTWSADRIVFSNRPSGQSCLFIKNGQGRKIHLFWLNAEEKGNHIMHMSSPDFGETWHLGGNEKGKINPGDGIRSEQLRVAAKDGILAATWNQFQVDKKRKIVANYSLDDGKTWLDSNVVLNLNSEDNTIYANPQIAIHKDRIFFLWARTTDKKVDLFFRCLTVKNRK